ncbi:MAG: YncE family protein, partial [Bacteroidales bacterium]|nr:YncE family protein [Bacteroidales bacterium]
QSDQVVRKQFITDGTIIETPYGLSVNPQNGDVFICEAYNYLTQGDVLCFSSDGKLKYRLSDVGLNPNAVIVW